MRNFTKGALYRAVGTFLVLWALGCGFGFAQAPDWKWQNLSPQGNHLMDIQIVNGDTLFAVGDCGTILKTTDGGVSWEDQNCGIIQSLASVYFTSTSHGCAVGYGGRIVTTRNGGASWKVRTTASGRSLNSVHFIDSQRGWSAGASGEILKTNDRGATWQIQQTLNGADLNSIFFKDSTHGWAVGNSGRILKTTNGGTNWVSQTSPVTQTLRSVFFTDTLIGWAVGQAGVIKTTNGGLTWQVVSGGSEAFRVYFSDSLHGWICGQSIIRTKDGGATWQGQSNVNGTILQSAHFADSLRGWAVGWYGRMQQTSDGGATWQNQSSGSIKDFRSVYFADYQNGWAISRYGAGLKTTDGGVSWQAAGGPGNYVNSVYYFDSQNAVAVCEVGHLNKTTDGGATWSNYQDIGYPSHLYSVHFTDTQTGWAVGDLGTIWKTTNGGTGWQIQPGITTKNLRSVFFIDHNTGWIGAIDGTLLKTTNGGITWQSQPSSTVRSINSIHFINAQMGWTAGDGPTITHTKNGGTTWQTQPVTAYDLYSIHFTSSQTGWAVGKFGKLMKTNNGGTTWNAQLSGTNNNLYSISFADPIHAWVVGDKGTVLAKNQIDGSTSSFSVTGKLFRKNPTNCLPGTVGLAGKVVKATPGPYYSLSNSNGNYNLRLPIDTHSVSVFSLSAIPVNEFMYEADPVCPTGNNYVIALDSVPDTLAGKNFGYLVTDCHLLNIEIASNRRRRCFTNNTNINYVNHGTASAPNAYILVEFPKYIRPKSSSRSYVALNDSVWRFNLGTVQPGQVGTISITDSVVCSAPIDLTQCTKATIYPAPDCPPSSNWSGAEVSVSGVCDQGVVHLGIHNTGSGDMTDSVDYTLFLDSTLVRFGKVKLASNDSLRFDVDAYGMSVTLSANQVPFHPTQSFVSTTIEACDDTTIYIPKPTVNHFPKPQVASSKTHCLPIRASYDPNDKQAFPIGFTSNHVVKPGTQMEYLVRFQNTGNDTAFTVYVIDSLDNNLNPESFELGAASHPFEISMQTTKQGRTFLRWQFNQINLPDSNTNELESHGFIQYRISPKAGITLGSKAKNEAAIYFDFNDPVGTNQTLTTFDNLVFTNPALSDSVHVVVPTQTTLNLQHLGVKLYPNPVTQNQLTVSFSSTGNLTMMNAQGQVVFRKENMEGTSIISMCLKPGIYMARISTGQGSTTEKIVVLK